MRGTSSPVKEASALQEWLCKDINAEIVELFVESGVDFTKMYEESLFSRLHFFAAGRAKDINALKMIVESGGRDERPRPDINARNHVGNTPLHLLMQRRTYPWTFSKHSSLLLPIPMQRPTCLCGHWHLPACGRSQSLLRYSSKAALLTLTTPSTMVPLLYTMPPGLVPRRA